MEKGKIIVDACEHDWRVKNDWSLSLGKQSLECKKCGVTEIV